MNLSSLIKECGDEFYGLRHFSRRDHPNCGKLEGNTVRRFGIERYEGILRILSICGQIRHREAWVLRDAPTQLDDVWPRILEEARLSCLPMLALVNAMRS
jgi:hypothetical protein